MGHQYGYITASKIPTSWTNWLDHTYAFDNFNHAWGCYGREAGGQSMVTAWGDCTVANCAAYPWETAGIVYGVTGVCHQCTNRVIFTTGRLIQGAKGMTISYALYGPWGRDFPTFLGKYGICLAINKNLEGFVESPAIKPEGNETEQDRLENALFVKIMDIYEPLVKELHIGEVVNPDEENELIVRSFEIYVKQTLGAKANQKDVRGLIDNQRSVIQKKKELDEKVRLRNINISGYAEGISDLMMEFTNASYERLGEKEYRVLFGERLREGVKLIEASKIESFLKRVK